MAEDIWQKLRKARKIKGLTQGALGAKMGLAQGKISQLEAGKLDLRLSTFQEIARLLDLEPMLIPRALTPAVRSVISGKPESAKPAWQPDTSIEEEDEELS